jgi:hypothetical protein
MVFLKADTVIRNIFGWESFPHHSMFGRLFKLIQHVHCHELSEAENPARRKVWSKKWFGLVTIDLDSSVRGVYGLQDGAARGYNPQKKVKEVIIRYSALVLNCWFRKTPWGSYSPN